MSQAAQREAQFQQELAPFIEAIERSPADALPWVEMGYHMLRFDKGDAAHGAFEIALKHQPGLARAESGLAWAYIQLEKLHAALEAFDAALRGAPDDPDLHYGRGLALFKLDRFEEAEPSYRRAIALRPRFFEAWGNLGTAYQLARRPQMALQVWREVLKIWPENPVAHGNIGTVYRELGRFDLEREAYLAALSIDPDYGFARFHLGALDLLLGNYEAGLRGVEWRRRLPEPIGYRPYLQPEWTGEAPVAGRRVLVHAEQGFGDTLLFCRYLPALADRGAQVIFASQNQLMALVKTLDPRIKVADLNARSEQFDLHLPLMSLPAALKAPFPLSPPALPYLHAEPERTARWRERLGAKGFKIGVAWRGSKMGAHLGRSWPLQALAPIAGIPGVRLISLQKGDGEDEAKTLDWPLENLGADFDAGPDAFLDAAAVMMSLDLIITVDSAIAHLAGALGRPVWTLLPKTPDWRWLLEAKETLWHPTMTLFRQTRRDDWKEPFQQIKARLEAMSAESA